MTGVSGGGQDTRWGVIGTGDISGKFVPDLQAVSGNNVHGVWGRTPERAEAFAAEHRIPYATADRADLLHRDDIDAVYIATPMRTHLDIALEALEAGKHILVEKPMGMSVEDVDTIFSRAQQVNLFAMEAMWMRFNPLHREVMGRVEEGLIGAVRSVRASFGMPFRPSTGTPTPAQNGSVWLDRGIYAVSLAHWALGAPTSIRADGVSLDGTDISGYATLEFHDGSFAHLSCSGVEFLDLSASISGTLGWATIRPMFWAGTTADLHAGSLGGIFHSPERLEHPRTGNGFRPMLHAVEQALTQGLLQHPDHDHESTRSVFVTVDAIRHQILTSEGA